MNKLSAKKYTLIALIVGFSVLATTYLSLWGTDLLSSIYGTTRPSTRAELCDFLEKKLDDKKLKDEKLIKRYTTDKKLHCKEADLKEDRGVPPSGSALTFFLRQASSGLQNLESSNNLLDHLLPDRHKPKVNPATVANALKALAEAI